VATVGSHVLVAGGTDGTRARREILSYDPRTGKTRVIGRLPSALGHAAGVALGGTFYVLGGRGDARTSQRAAIWAVNPSTGRVRRAGTLPTALSDLAAVAVDGHILVAGGRDAAGTVHDELWTLAARG
jgi:N-acetylneuraminic acid mutarotase